MCALENVAAVPGFLRSVRTIIREGGGEYVGIQRGVWQAGSPDLVLFNDPLTGTTLALAASATLVTVRHVRAKIAESRSTFAAVRESRAHRESRRSDPPTEVLWSRGTKCANQPAFLVCLPRGSGSGLKRTTGDSPDVAPLASPKGQIPAPARIRIAGHGMELKM